METGTPTHSTLLAALWAGEEGEVIAALSEGSLVLTGNFKGHEAEIAAAAAAS